MVELLLSDDVLEPSWFILSAICLQCLGASLWWPYPQCLLCNSLLQNVFKSMQNFSLLLTGFVQGSDLNTHGKPQL